MPAFMQTVLDDTSAGAALSTLGGLGGSVLFDSELGADAASIDSGAGGFATTFDSLRILIYSRTTEAAVGSSLSLTFNNDGAANYDRQVMSWTNVTAGVGIALAATAHVLATLGANAQAGAFGILVCDIPAYGSTVGHKAMTVLASMLEDTAADSSSSYTATRWRSTAAINRVIIDAAGAANFLTGTRMTIIGIG